MSEDVRLVAWVRGHVQGVGFRWFTRAKALEIGGLSGFALNLGDGRVQVVAEGPRKGCEGLLEWLQSDDTPGRVDGVTEIWDTPRGGYDGFAIRWRLRAEPPGGRARACRRHPPPGESGRWLRESLASAGSARKDDRHVPRVPKESQRRRSRPRAPRLPANTGRDRVDRQTFW